MKRKERGITLIALVITIIVMLILVVVTVSVALQGGLFGKAQEAKTNTEEAQIQEREISTGRIKVGDKWYDSLDKYLEGTPSDNQNEGTLKVALKVDEANVNGTQIPITVEKVTKGEDESQVVEGNLTYEWYYEENNKSTDGNKHTFNNLSADQSYTLKCRVVAPDDSWGVGSVTVISFKIHNKYYRATEGMTWQKFINSKYDKTPPDLSGFDEHDHSEEPRWSNLNFGYDGHEVGFGCLTCTPSYEPDYGYEYPGASVEGVDLGNGNKEITNRRRL